MEKIKVILSCSLAYSGSTWANLVFGSHEKAFCVGAGDRLFVNGASDPGAMCLLHGPRCEFWPDFFKSYEPEENFIVQLAGYTGKEVFVMNNPSHEVFQSQLDDERIDLRVIKLVRDGRASLASAMRHHPHRVRSVYQSAVAWLYRGNIGLERRIARTGHDPLLIRYEDMVENPADVLERVANFTGVDYDARSLRYWQYPHHLATGNQGAIDVLIRMEDGGEGIEHGRKQYYDELLDHLKRTDGVPRLDFSWRDMYSEVDKAAYNHVAGELYEAYGYPCFEVSEEAHQEFLSVFHPAANIEEALKTMPQWRLPSERSGGKGAGSWARGGRFLSRYLNFLRKQIAGRWFF